MESGLVCLLTKLFMTTTLQVRFKVPHCSDCEANYYLGCNMCILMIEIVSSEVSVHMCQTTGCHIQKDRNFQNAS
jgi:hypothetical protein